MSTPSAPNSLRPKAVKIPALNYSDLSEKQLSRIILYRSAKDQFIKRFYIFFTSELLTFTIFLFVFR